MVRLRQAQAALRSARAELLARIQSAAAMAGHCRATAEAFALRSSCLAEAMQGQTPSANVQALHDTAVRLRGQARTVQADAEHRLQALNRHRSRLDRALDAMAHSEARLDLAAREAAGREKLRALGRYAVPAPGAHGRDLGLEDELREAARLAHQALALAELKGERA